MDNNIKKIQARLNELLTEISSGCDIPADYLNLYRACSLLAESARNACIDHCGFEYRKHCDNISNNLYPVTISVRGDNIIFRIPPLLNSQYGALANEYSRSVCSQIYDLATTAGIERRNNQLVSFIHHINQTSPVQDYDNLEIRDILNTLVDCAITDDSMQSYSLYHTSVIIPDDEYPYCAIIISPA